jgi:uncharacterized protein
VGWLGTLRAAAELIEISERIAACRDPTDDKFREPAGHGKADMIVSGDADLLALNPFRDIPIVKPSACRTPASKRARGGCRRAIVIRVRA